MQGFILPFVLGTKQNKDLCFPLLLRVEFGHHFHLILFQNSEQAYSLKSPHGTKSHIHARFTVK